MGIKFQDEWGVCKYQKNPAEADTTATAYVRQCDTVLHNLSQPQAT